MLSDALRAKLCLSLPCLLLTLSAHPTSSMPYCYWLGPFCEGKQLQLSFSVDPTAYPGCYLFLQAKFLGPRYQGRIDRYVAISTLPLNEDGTVTFNAPIKDAGWKEGDTMSYVLGVSRVRPYQDIAFSDTAVYVTDRRVFSKSQDHFLVEENGPLLTGASYYVYDPSVDPRHRQEKDELYEISGMTLGSDLSSRRFPLSALKVQYENEHIHPKYKPVCELRISTFMDDFLDLGESHGGYVAIPLKAEIKQEGSVFTYAFSLLQETYYSRVDLSASSVPFDDVPCFSSKDVFFPLRRGHDDALYEYVLYLESAGAFGDTLLLKGSCRSRRLIFGDCDYAEYCLVAGGET